MTSSIGYYCCTRLMLIVGHVCISPLGFISSFLLSIDTLRRSIHPRPWPRRSRRRCARARTRRTSSASTSTVSASAFSRWRTMTRPRWTAYASSRRGRVRRTPWPAALASIWTSGTSPSSFYNLPISFSSPIVRSSSKTRSPSCSIRSSARGGPPPAPGPRSSMPCGIRKRAPSHLSSKGSGRPLVVIN